MAGRYKMRFRYRRFQEYEDFVKFCEDVETWNLHSWQDVGGNYDIDIRAVFTQVIMHPDSGAVEKPFPEGV
jgi:hypothetical protein